MSPVKPGIKDGVVVPKVVTDKTEVASQIPMTIASEKAADHPEGAAASATSSSKVVVIGPSSSNRDTAAGQLQRLDVDTSVIDARGST
jgi:hypothetical protein